MTNILNILKLILSYEIVYMFYGIFHNNFVLCWKAAILTIYTIKSDIYNISFNICLQSSKGRILQIEIRGKIVIHHLLSPLWLKCITFKTFGSTWYLTQHKYFGAFPPNLLLDQRPLTLAKFQSWWLYLYSAPSTRCNIL